MSGGNSHMKSNKRQILKQIWGELMTESNFYSEILMNEGTRCLQQKEDGPPPGRKGRSLSPTRTL